MRIKRFTFLCTTSEREAISLLAKFHHRSQGDVVRLLILEAMNTLSNVTGLTVTQRSVDIPLTKFNFQQEDK